METLKDMEGRKEVQELVDAFDDKVNRDPLLSPIFNRIAAVDWESHLPTMYDFWDSLLFGSQRYKGKPFPKHLALPLSKAHFQRWLELFRATVDERFTGTKAEEANARAASIAGIFQFKMESLGALQDDDAGKA